MGDPASLRVFRAGRNYLRLRLATWGFAQALAFAGLLFWTAILIDVEIASRLERTERTKQPVPGASAANPTPAAPATPQDDRRNPVEKFAKRFEANVRAAQARKHFPPWVAFKQSCVELALLLPTWAFPLIWGVKIFSFTVYLVQLPITYAVRRLDYEMRWYMVTDRSLRLRHGVWKVSETTMSFANIQQVVVSKGPVQGLLGLADVKVQSAGGASGGEKHANKEDMHLGLFHSVTHAAEIRDLILERLRLFRETGLGDQKRTSDPLPPPVSGTSSVTAARELLAEAKALRRALA
jgi:membrane protein YdbS with pleckstrin-like domain